MLNNEKTIRFEDFAAVSQDGGDVLGKVLYYSLSSILIDRDELESLCDAVGFPKGRSNRTAMGDAFRSATGDIYERRVVKTDSGPQIFKVYCRDNKGGNASVISRELVKETVHEDTNEYRKLANITFNKTSKLFSYTILEGLRLQVADQLMRAPLGEVESRPIGAMKSTIVDRIEDVEPPLAHMIPELSSNLLLPLAVVIAMFAIDWRMGLALLVTIPVALVPMAAGMRSYNKNYAAYMAANNHVNSVIVGYVEGIQVVKAFSQGERSYAKFAQAVSSFRDFTLNWFRCTWASMNLCLSILPTTLLGTLPVGIYLYQTGVLDPAQVTLCLMMALGIVSPLMRATAFINSMKSMQFAVKDTRELLDLPQLSQAKQEADLDGSGIRFRNVAFSYGGTGGAEVLHDLELHIPQGSFTALVGPSGGGKSTIARLAARFWDVTAGSITLGGRDIREMPLKQLSQAISFVTQDNFLFDCSLKENIRLGKPDASDEEVLAAARAAQCEEFLARLDRGWDTPAGEAGRQLSGGERQRIAIARAILKDAPIVILDEATAFTDPENEDKIQSSIMALSKGKTLLVIAHRLSTIQNADQIVVLEKGHIVDQGTQAELLRRCLLYQKLWQAHIGAQGWAVTSGAKEGQ